MKITECIHTLKIPFQIKGPQGMALERFVYMYLIFGKKIYLIDSGVSSAEGVIFDYRQNKRVNSLFLEKETSGAQKEREIGIVSPEFPKFGFLSICYLISIF